MHDDPSGGACDGQGYSDPFEELRGQQGEQRTLRGPEYFPYPDLLDPACRHKGGESEQSQAGDQERDDIGGQLASDLVERLLPRNYRADVLGKRVGLLTCPTAVDCEYSLIADRFDDDTVRVDTISAENDLVDDTIYPDQLLDVCVDNGLDDRTGEARAPNQALVAEATKANKAAAVRWV